MLHLLRSEERVKLGPAPRDEEIAALSEARINAGLFTEAQQLFAREQGEADVDVRAELRAESARRAPRAPLARLRSALKHQNVAAAPRREVVGHTRADDSAPDDDDFG